MTETRTWVEADVQIELSWNPYSHLELYVAPVGGLALKRYSFGFDPYLFHQVPVVVFSGIAGIGLQFD